MTPERWNTLKAAFNLALESGGAAPDLLADDPELRSELLALLDESSAVGDTLENPPWRDRWPLGARPNDDSQTEAPPALAPGTRTGGYTIRALLGRGGMGEVYRAQQASPRRDVALKIIRPGLPSRHAVRRLEAEAAILARLQHPGIAAVIEAGVLPPTAGPEGPAHSTRPFFSMELIEGSPITAFTRDQGLSVGAKVVLMRLVCEAVAYAHQRGVIHRDLKPANILVDAQGKPKVLDFGIARLIDRESGHTLTQPGWVPGTLAYMSPEQASGDADAVDTRSDVYSLGVVLYEMLADRLPISPDGKSHVEMLRAIREDEPVRADRVCKAASGDLGTVLAAALHKNPAQRYQSAAALADDLGRVLRREPIAARRPSTGYLVRVFARRHWRELTVAGVALAAGLGLAGWQFNRAVAAERLARQRLDDVRRTSREMVTDLYDKLWEFPSVADARVYLAGEAVRRLEQIVAAAGDDPEALWDLSNAMLKLGKPLGHPGQANLGRREDSAALILRAHALQEEVLAGSPRSRDYRLGVASSAVSAALITADGTARDALMQRAIGLYQSVADDSPEDLGLRNTLAYTVAARATECARRGEPSEEGFARAKAICADLVAKDPSGNLWLGTLGTVVNLHAESLRGVDPARATEIAREAREILSRAHDREPEEYSYARHLTRANRIIAQDRASKGRWPDAIALADEMIATHRTWLQREPRNSAYRLGLADTLIAAAEFRLGAGGDDAAGAMTLIEEARSLALDSKPEAEITPEDRQRLDLANQLAEQARNR